MLLIFWPCKGTPALPLAPLFAIYLLVSWVRSVNAFCGFTNDPSKNISAESVFGFLSKPWPIKVSSSPASISTLAYRSSNDSLLTKFSSSFGTLIFYFRFISKSPISLAPSEIVRSKSSSLSLELSTIKLLLGSKTTFFGQTWLWVKFFYCVVRFL